MSPNSCLYRAVRDVCKRQFQIDVSSEVFDAHNTGEGIRFGDMFSVTDEALEPLGIRVDIIVGSIIGEFSHRHLVTDDNFVPAPCIALSQKQQHAFAIFPEDPGRTCSVAFTLGRR